MIDYTKFYKAKCRSVNDNSCKKDTELEEYKKLIQKLGYTHVND